MVAEGLCKRFGATVALDHLDLRVAAGSVVGLLGPNGAGKTTVVRLLATVTRPTGGRATVAGFDVATQATQVRHVVALAGQFAAVDEKLTGRENLRIFCDLYRLDRRQSRRRTGELLERFELTGAADRLVSTYSGGMRRRLDLAASLIVAPRLLFLDEPTVGLDPRGRLEIWADIKQLAEAGTTVLLTTQYLDEADHLADRVVVIDHGRAIAEGTPDQLKAQVGGEDLEVTVSNERDIETVARCLHHATTQSPTVDRHRRTVSTAITAGFRDVAAMVRELDFAAVEIADLTVRRATLDDVFLRLTGRPTDQTGMEPVAEASR